ncbi:hypothetical protein G7Y79_00060g092040 [Physcia stellaris]|nr:hypothetical protein G7Y79_00060g092040 [Physcia stellaris]
MIRLKRNGLALLAVFVAFLILLDFQLGLHHRFPSVNYTGEAGSQKPKPVYKPTPDPPPPIEDNFPKAASAKKSGEIPKIPTWNMPPSPHVPEDTPLFIGFTRNWRLLQQVVVSYITAGWPAQDIYVVENTGVMHSNKEGRLSLQNPFYIDYNRLTKILGVNVLITPTLFTFAQLQNFYTFTAVEKGWKQYFWAHMDTVMISDEAWETAGEEGKPKSYKSAYSRAVEVMRESMDPKYGKEPGFGPLATRWFSYDRLALVRTQAFVDVGGWDTMIPFYMTDCDMHERLWMKNFTIENADAGRVWDLDTALDDLEILYHRGELDKPAGRRADAQRNSPKYHDIIAKLDEMGHVKSSREGGRNTWQARQKGGQGDPFYRDSDGFEKGIQMTMDLGRNVFEEKWGRGPCDLRESGLKDSDAWRVVKDWEKPDVQRQARKDREREAKEQAQREKEEKEKQEKEQAEKEKQRSG